MADSDRAAQTSAQAKSQADASAEKTSLFQRVDWLALAVTFTVILLLYFFTLAPEVTLEDSGELVTAAYYGGIPHPPGYPLWTLYGWLWTNLLPIGNIAWRAAVGNAVAQSLACGMVALIVSSGAGLFFRSLERLSRLSDRRKGTIRCLAGVSAGMLLGVNSEFWKHSVAVNRVAIFCVPWFLLMLVFLLRWLHSPQRFRYAYGAIFLFALGVVAHQTLILAVIGIQAALLMGNKRLGRDLFFGNYIVYLICCFIPPVILRIQAQQGLYSAFTAIGIGSLIIGGVLAIRTRGLMSEWKRIVMMAFLWVCGISLYLYLPLAGSTNPPMQWSYPRTAEGFISAVRRENYNQVDPTDVAGEPLRVGAQLAALVSNAAEQFTWPGVILALLPLALLLRMNQLLRAWLITTAVLYACVGGVLAIVLGTPSDPVFVQLNRIFFLPSQAVLVCLIGWGVSILAAYAALQRKRVMVAAVLAIFVATPIGLGISRYQRCEQRNHWFGYWYGHDMFMPPFKGADGSPLYSEMPRGAILFGGSDAGRFCATYMVYVESFTPHTAQPVLDQNFDRRDVYVLSQNGLCSAIYLNEIRAQYNRSRQADPPFLGDCARKLLNLGEGQSPWLVRAVSPVDRGITQWGAALERRRRQAGVYPQPELKIPSQDDLNKSTLDYVIDLKRRIELNRLGPGEQFKLVNGQLQVGGVAGGLKVNEQMSRQIFDQNPGHDFFLEESLALPWMYPHATPYGIILKINRQPLPALPPDVIDRDHQFWVQYSARLTGAVVKYDTSIPDLAEWIERVYLRRDLSAFAGDRKFIYDQDAQRSFSKLRCIIAGLYAWRLSRQCPPEYGPHSQAEADRLAREADFAFRQAWAFGPSSTDTVLRYASLLFQIGRVADARTVTETCLKLDPDNIQVRESLKTMK